MFEVRLTNFGIVIGSYKTLREAVAVGRSKGYEFSVLENGRMVGFAEGVTLQWHDVL